MGSSVTEKHLAPRLEVRQENLPPRETVAPFANSCHPVRHASGARDSSQEALWEKLVLWTPGVSLEGTLT